MWVDFRDDDVVEDGVAKVLEAFERAGCACSRGDVRGMREGFDEEGGFGEFVAEEFLKWLEDGREWEVGCALVEEGLSS